MYAGRWIRKYIRQAIEKARHAPSLTAVLPDVPGDDPAEEEAGRALDRLWDAIDSLPPADRRVLVRRYGLDGRARWTREEIAARWRMSVYAVKASLRRSLDVVGDTLRGHDR